jgi:hypothetical protein
MPILILILLAGMAAAQTLKTPRLSCETENTTTSTIITAKVKGSDTPIKFRIDWLSGNETPENFKNHLVEGRSLTSTHRLGKTTVTRTILASAAADCIFIHVIADQPGVVSFSAKFVGKNPTKIHDRREIILSGKKTNAHAWVIPFESDVHDDGKGTIFLNGEGEALIILNLTSNLDTSPIVDTLTRLGKKFDPTHSPPSPHLIWEGVKP